MNIRRFSWLTGALAIAMLTVPGAAPRAAAQGRPDTVYTIANYPVDARAQDAVTAKEKALADGQQAALRSLLKRLVPVSAYGKLKAFRKVKAGDLVEGVSVRSERNSSTQYMANLDFTFSPQAVRALLRREGVPYHDAQASQAVIVPIVKGAQGMEPAGSPNSKSWSDAWGGLDLEHALTPARLSAPQAPLSADLLKRLIAGEPSGVQQIATHFRSDLAVAVIAEPEPAAKRLNVWLSGSDASGPVFLKRSYRVSDGDLGYAMELAAVVALGVLEGRWKATALGGRSDTATLSQSAETFEITVEFRSRAQWEEMRSRLDQIYGVEDVDVVSLSTRNATLAMRFPGGVNELAVVVETQGMQLQRAGNAWTLRPIR